MSCEYCRNKVKNKYLVETDDYSSGVDAKIIKNDGVAFLAVSGWYDGWQSGAVGIEPELTSIMFCPKCGRKLVK